VPYETQSAEVRQAYDQIYQLALERHSSGEACEDFLLAWYNVKAWGGWAPQSISALDRSNSQALLTLLSSVQAGTWYPSSADMDRLVERKQRRPVSRRR
jgi:hypothetical protein